MRLDISAFNRYPEVDKKKIDKLLAEEIEKNHTKFVVLDDDPTGVQTVHDVSVFTDWSEESIRCGFAEENKLFYILTNSRSLTADQTIKVHREIAATVGKIGKETGKEYLFFSRSDSTLRGHYPLETMVLKDCMEQDGVMIDGEILCPFFQEGGRVTIDNIHYVKLGTELVPAAETEFAKDRTFGYTKSNIPEYIEEKTNGDWKAEDVTCISLDSIRSMDIEGIQQQLESVVNFNKICVNAIDYYDIKVFAIALFRAMANQKKFIFRSAAGLVKVIGGISDKPLLTRNDMVRYPTENGGIVVVGSHTQKTTEQLKELLTLENVEAIEFRSNLVLEGEEAFSAEVDRCVAEEEKAIRAGKVAVCFTNRTLLIVDGDTREEALIRSVKISDGVQSLVARLTVTPAFIVAKGGITSSRIGTKALCVKRATVLGQIRPGIPVWQTGEESKFPFTPYVIFPGNVGEQTTLREVVEILSGNGTVSGGSHVS